MNQMTHLSKCIGLLDKLNDLQAELKNEQENLLSKRKMFPNVSNIDNQITIAELERDIIKTKIDFNTEIRLIEPLN